MALGALAISPGMTPLSMGGQKVSETNPLPITIVPGKRDLKGDDSGDSLIKAVMDQTAADIESSKISDERMADIGNRLLEALTGRSEQGGKQPKPKSASQKASERDKKIAKSDTSDLKEDRKMMTDTLKDVFGGIDGQQGMKDSLKMFLLASGLLILFKFGDQIAGFLAPVLGFIKKTLIPGLKSLFDVFIKNPLGIAPFIVAASLGIKAIGRYFTMVGRAFKLIKAITGDGRRTKFLGGNAKNFNKTTKLLFSLVTSVRKFFKMLSKAIGTKTISVFSKIGSIVSKGFGVLGKVMGGVGKVAGIFGKLSGLSKVFGVALKFAKAIPGLGQIIMLIQGIVGAVTGFIDGFKEGGILGGLKGALIGVWDGIVGSFANLIKDLLAWFLGVLGFDKAAEFFSNLDFSFEGIKAGFFFIVDKIMGAFNALVDGAKGMANLVIRGINKIRTKIGLEPYEEFELSGQTGSAESSVSGNSVNSRKERKARKKAEEAEKTKDFVEKQKGFFSKLFSPKDAKDETSDEIAPLPAVISGEVQTATGIDYMKGGAIDSIARSSAAIAKLTKMEFTQSQKLAEAQAESPAKGGGVVVVNNSTSNNTNNSNSTTQNMGNMLSSTHSDPTQDLLSKANI